MKKTTVSTIAALLLTGLLAGCGSNGNKEQPGQEASGGKMTVIRVANSGSEQEKQVRYDTAELFMKAHPNIKIEWVDLGSERYQKTLTLISGGNAPDILYMNEWTVPLAERGV